MKNKSGKLIWVAPILEQIEMANTSEKATSTNEGLQPDGSMVMAQAGGGMMAS
jgi:hypothetical protein